MRRRDEDFLCRILGIPNDHLPVLVQFDDDIALAVAALDTDFVILADLGDDLTARAAHDLEAIRALHMDPPFSWNSRLFLPALLRRPSALCKSIL